MTEYGWDHRNRMTSVVTKDSGGTIIKAVEYTYDVYDRRIAKSVDSDRNGTTPATEERYVYDGDRIALVFDDEGNQLSRYLHGPQIDQILAEETADGDVRWALSDHQGSVRDVVDSEGTVLNHLTYDSYGQVASETNPDVDFLFGYTGRERDEETGLYYYRARYFAPAVGTFVSEDPLGFEAGDANVYRYVGNSPTNAVDPSGLLTIYRGNPIRDVLSNPLLPGGGLGGALFDRFAPRALREFDVNLSVNAGEQFGLEAQEYYAQEFIDECNSGLERVIAFVGGSLSSLWTPDTSDATFATLSTAWGLARPAASTTLDDALSGLQGMFDRRRGIGRRLEPGPANFMRDSDGFLINASHRSDIDPNGFFDVVAHGTPNRIQLQTPSGPTLVNHRTAARLIQQQPGYNGQNIRLLSCSTGSCDTGFAQNLANRLNVEVSAPTDILWASPHGQLFVAPFTANGKPNLSSPGSFRNFRPGLNSVHNGGI